MKRLAVFRPDHIQGNREENPVWLTRRVVVPFPPGKRAKGPERLESLACDEHPFAPCFFPGPGARSAARAPDKVLSGGRLATLSKQAGAEGLVKGAWKREPAPRTFTLASGHRYGVAEEEHVGRFNEECFHCVDSGLVKRFTKAQAIQK